jgi:putative transferase (TIGR04331 family)
VIINRYSTLEQALNNYDITETIILECPDSNLSDLTSMGFIKHLNNDLWNHRLYANMLQHWPNLNLDFVQKTIKDKSQTNQKRQKNTRIDWNIIIKSMVLIIFRLLSIFKRKSDALILKSYLPIFKEIQLQLLLGQAPQLWKTPKVVHINVNTKLRSCFFQNYKEHQGIEREVRRLIHVLIPVCYLEGYKSISKQSDSLPWPLKPRFIYTSNSFSTDEIFKLWVAKKSESGVPYYIGQHGANYGTLSGSEIWPEITTCDKFFSWGWDGVYSSHKSVPAFVFNIANRNRADYDKRGGLLLIERGPGNRDGCQDRFYEHILYQKHVFRFFTTIDESIQERVTVRLHHGSKENNSSDVHLWKLQDSNIVIDEGFINIYKLIQRNRIVVHSYNSTGILETLSLNIPTVCFWRGGLDDLLSDAIPFYELLIDAGIVSVSPEDAAIHITAYWDDLDLWWGSEKVQNARKVFCNKYAKRVKSPALTLRNLLVDNL